VEPRFRTRFECRQLLNRACFRSSLPIGAAGPRRDGFAAYHGYTYDLSEYAGRKDFDASRQSHRQIDMVKNAGFSPVAEVPAFRTAERKPNDMHEEGAAWACYGRSGP